jgi:hypothetical protein
MLKDVGGCHCGSESFCVLRSHPDGTGGNVHCVDPAKISGGSVPPFDDANRERSIRGLPSG